LMILWLALPGKQALYCLGIIYLLGEIQQ